MYLKSKIKLKSSHQKDLMDNFPDAFEKVCTPNVFIDKRPFIKMTKQEFMVDIAKKLGAYTQYVVILMQTISDENHIDMNSIDRAGYPIATKKRAISKLKKHGIIKRNKSSYYMNPAVATRYSKVHIDLIKMFEKENLELYNIKLG